MKYRHSFATVIKQLLDEVFVKSRIIEVEGKGYQPQSSASADNPYLDLDHSGYHKNLIQQEAPGSPYSCAESYKLYKIGTQGVHVRQAI